MSRRSSTSCSKFTCVLSLSRKVNPRARAYRQPEHVEDREDEYPGEPERDHEDAQAREQAAEPQVGLVALGVLQLHLHVRVQPVPSATPTAISMTSTLPSGGKLMKFDAGEDLVHA